jgi:hypothetical protein
MTNTPLFNASFLSLLTSLFVIGDGDDINDEKIAGTQFCFGNMDVAVSRRDDEHSPM